MSQVGNGTIAGKWTTKEALASSDFVTMSATLDSTAWIDEGYADEIPPFITVAIDPTTKRAVPYDNGVHTADNVYLLVDWEYNIVAGQDRPVSLFTQCIVKSGYVTETSVVTWSSVQRIEIRPVGPVT